MKDLNGRIIKEVELLAVRDGVYTVYVFKVLNEENYVMCTRLPNWQVPEISIGDQGFLQYQIVNAGDKYVTPDGEKDIFRYSNCYFINFVNKSDIVKNKEIIM
jgi:hypothetical protein